MEKKKVPLKPKKRKTAFAKAPQKSKDLRRVMAMALADTRRAKA